MKIKPDIFEIFRAFLRYLLKTFEIFRKKSVISGNIFRRFYVIFVSRLSWEGRRKKGSSQILQ